MIVVLTCVDASSLAAGCEEEGVPVLIRRCEGSAEALARLAAAESLLGIGVSIDARGGMIVLAAAPGSPYLTGTDLRLLGHQAACIAARRPLAGLRLTL